MASQPSVNNLVLSDTETTLVICQKNGLIEEIIGSHHNLQVGTSFDETQLSSVAIDYKSGQRFDYYLLASPSYSKDPLTDCHLRDALEPHFSALKQRASWALLVLIDVDHLKSINDNQGHLAGDASLQSLADYLKKHFRQDDLLIRYGGDEFLLLLPVVSNSQGVTEEYRLNTLLPQFRELLDKRLTNAPIAISWGTAFFPQDGGDLQSLIAAADERLYRMKKHK